MDEDFVKAVQNEYATRYLEQMNLRATQSNIEKLLQKEPLSACQLKPVWNNAGWLADSLTVIPNCKDGSYEHIQHKLKHRNMSHGAGAGKQKDTFGSAFDKKEPSSF